MKVIIVSLFSLLLMSCSRNKEEIVVPHQYAGDWDFVANSGSLFFFFIDIKLHQNGSATLNSTMKDNNFVYPESLGQWSRIESDSILFKFDIPAYPSESWEFRGLANADNDMVSGNYFMINKSTKEKTSFGAAVLTID